MNTNFKQNIQEFESTKRVRSQRSSWMQSLGCALMIIPMVFAIAYAMDYRNKSAMIKLIQDTGVSLTEAIQLITPGVADAIALRWWSAWLAFSIWLVIEAFTRISQHWHLWQRLVTAICLGLVCGYVFTFCVAIILGPWFGAFGVPVLYCWMGGGVVAFVTSFFVNRRTE